MTEKTTQNPAGLPDGAETMTLAEAFRTIGELARLAAKGDEEAKLALEIIQNEQLAEIRNLELELQALNIRAITAATISFMPLPGKPVS